MHNSNFDSQKLEIYGCVACEMPHRKGKDEVETEKGMMMSMMGMIMMLIMVMMIEWASQRLKRKVTEDNLIITTGRADKMSG